MKLFDTFECDQVDFHHYALRRQAIHAYTKFIEYVDNIKTDNFYLVAVNEGSALSEGNAEEGKSNGANEHASK